MHSGPRIPLSSDARLTLESLGAARLVVSHADGTTTVALDAGKPLALITYLTAAPQHRASREHCLDLLWADLEPDAAKHALRQTLWYLKRKVADGIITTSGDALILAAPIEPDRALLIAAAEDGDHARVVDLYKGDFLPSFAAPGGAEFEQWADVERRRLRNLFYRSAEHETHRLLTSGRTREAVMLARRARDLEPLHQPGWRLLLEVLIAVADATGAQLEADALESIATRDDIELEPPTRALVRVARQTPNDARAKSERGRALVAELVGREREFAQILAAWEDARAGRGRHIHIRAAAGLGKTRLLNDVHARLRASRARVRVARFRIGTREVPYVGAAEIAGSLADLPGAKGVSSESASVLLALNPAISSIFQSGTAETAQGADALRRRAVALKELLVTVSEDHPVALLLDDVHWSDEPSRALLTHLIDEVDQRKLLLLTTGRPTPAGRIETAHTLTIDLPPLGENDTHALVTSLAALPDAPWTNTFPSELLRASLGSPLRTLETLQLLMDRGLLERTEQEWRTSAPDRLTAALREGDALKHRIAQLSKSERWLLLLLSVTGVPLARRTLSDLSQLPDAECAQSVSALEAHGFIAHQGEALTPAHDEIGELAVELAPADTQRAAHTVLGRHLWQQPDATLPTLRRAASHLARAGEATALAATFLRFIRASRHLGDTRSHVALADDLLGSLTGATRVRELVRSLPIHVRVGLTSGRRVAAAIALITALPLAIAITAAIATRDAPLPDAELVVFDIRQSGEGRTIPLLASEWPVGTPINFPRAANIRVEGPSNWPPMEIPGGRGHWLYSASVADSGIIDVFLSDQKRQTRLTHGAGDDMLESVSPDGRYALISTARWHPLSRYDLAIVDLETEAARQLTSGPDTDAAAFWSPDGTQIAFLRRSFTELARRVCRVRFDGSGMGCSSVVTDVQLVLGWLDETKVLLIRGDDTDAQLAALDLVDGELTLIRPDLNARNGSVAPNGQFAACLCSRRGADEWRWHVFPLGRESESRVLAGTTQESTTLRWRAPQSPTGLRSLTIGDQNATLQVDVPHQFVATGVMHDGQEAHLRWLRWSSSDPGVVAIDSATGLAIPRREGTATILVDAGGRVRTERMMHVARRFAAQPTAEDWSVPLDKNWLTVGAPAPYIDTVGGRAVLRPNGDGSNESGIVSLRTIAVDQGAALDAELSVRLTLSQWQSVGVGLEELHLASWPASHRERGVSMGKTSACLATYPAGENSVWADSMGIFAVPELVRVGAPARARVGTWWRLRIQVLPDGRCGIALNGVPIFISRGPVGLGVNTRVHVYGNSHETDALVGRLTLWRGVPNDIDWALFERKQQDGRLTPDKQ